MEDEKAGVEPFLPSTMPCRRANRPLVLVSRAAASAARAVAACEQQVEMDGAHQSPDHMDKQPGHILGGDMTIIY